MPPKKKAKKSQCHSCGKSFTSLNLHYSLSHKCQPPTTVAALKFAKASAISSKKLSFLRPDQKQLFKFFTSTEQKFKPNDPTVMDSKNTKPMTVDIDQEYDDPLTTFEDGSLPSQDDGPNQTIPPIPLPILFDTDENDEIVGLASSDSVVTGFNSQAATSLQNRVMVDVDIPPNREKESENYDHGWEEFLIDDTEYDTKFPFLKEDEFSLRILDVLENSQCPRHVFGDVMKIVRDCHSKNTNFHNVRTSRAAFMKQLRKQFPVPEKKIKYVRLESKMPVDVDVYLKARLESMQVVTFDFSEQLQSILQDEYLCGNMDNLQVNEGNPWGKYVSRNKDEIDDLHSSRWYSDTYDELIGNPERELMVPIILYIDKTGTDLMNRYGVEPLLFTTSLLRRSVRNKSSSWRVLGFIPALDHTSSAMKEGTRNTKATRGESIRNYHRCLDAILESLIEFQQSKHTSFVRLGNKVKKVQLITPVAFVIGDAKSQDHLCVRYGGYNSKRVCRACNCPFQELDNPRHVCQKVNVKYLEELVKTYFDEGASAAARSAAAKALHENSTHACRSALGRLNFGSLNNGYLDGTPTDLMHAFLEGVLKYTLNIFVDSLSRKHRESIDILVETMFRPIRNSQSVFFPRMNFTFGITNLTMITAEEWVGVAFCYLIVCLSSRGRTMLDGIHESSMFETVNGDDLPISPVDLYETLEAMLCFHAWYKYGFPYDGSEEVIQNYDLSVRNMLQLVVDRFPRRKGNGWKLQKFHELTHVVRDLENFGCPANYDSGPCENSLIWFAKDPSKTTQKRSHEVFQWQLADRLEERDCIIKSMKKLQIDGCLYRQNQSKHVIQTSHNPPLGVVSHFMNGNPKFEIIFGDKANMTAWKWRQGEQKSVVDMHPLVIHEACKFAVRRHLVSSTISGYTEYKRDGYVYRAHPNYQSEGAWYDWVMVKYQMDETGNNTEYYPCKILAFLKTDESEDNMYAVVHPGGQHLETEDSVVSQKWQMDYALDRPNHKYTPTLDTISVDSFEKPIYVIEEFPGIYESLDVIESGHDPRLVLVIKERTEWAQEFTWSKEDS